jgi:ribosomal protein S18 acetylase RimI-like enzyme
MAPPKINLAPALPSDYLAIARLESAAFAHEEFGKVAFGPYRLTDAARDAEAKKLARASKPGETKHHIKAVTILPGGIEEIVGFAGWTICVGRKGSEEEKVRLGTKEGWVQEEKEKGEQRRDEEEHGNAKLREYAFGKGDEIMARSTQGKDYMTLFVLVVSPKYQRRGIGTMLFEDGLKIADEAGLQIVLGASDQGVNLYKKYCCVEVEIMDLNLWEYKGGEGLGVTRIFFLHRLAVSSGSAINT